MFLFYQFVKNNSTILVFFYKFFICKVGVILSIIESVELFPIIEKRAPFLMLLAQRFFL